MVMEPFYYGPVLAARHRSPGLDKMGGFFVKLPKFEDGFTELKNFPGPERFREVAIGSH